MKPAKKTNKPLQGFSKGFALVVSLTMLVLLTVIAVGLLSLSAITLRTSTQSAAQAEAQANARLALMMAIGELQKQLGPDQRISANSAILDESNVSHPHWTGVWNSWLAGRSSATPSNPSATSDHRTIPGDRAVLNGLSPTYTPNRDDHFRSWLLSLYPSERMDINAPRSSSMSAVKLPDGDNDAIILVGNGSLGPDQTADHVSVRLLPVRENENTSVNGRYGWWVGDESQKARIMNDNYVSSPDNTVAGRLFRQQAPGSMGTNTIPGLENVVNSDQLSALPSLLTVGLLDGATEQAARNFHSITPYTYHVLADVREGGLKRDLSALLERPIDPNERSNDFMLYKFENGKDTWLPYNDMEEVVPIQDLAAYYQLYDSNRSGWRTGVEYASNLLSNGMQVVSPDYGRREDPKYFREYTSVYRQPVPVKIQFLMSLLAEEIEDAEDPSRGNPNPDTHLLYFGITPSVTLWNPTNLPMVMNFDENNPDFHAITIRTRPTPVRLRVIKNKGEYTSSWRNLLTYRGTSHPLPEFINLYFSGKRPIRFEPGEVKAFSLDFQGERDQSGRKADGGLGGRWTRAQHMESLLSKTDRYFEPLEVHAGWNPESFMFLKHSAIGGANANVHTQGGKLKFRAADEIFVEIDGKNTQLGGGRGAFDFHIIQSNYQDHRYSSWGLRHYYLSTHVGSDSEAIMRKGFPREIEVIRLAGRRGGNLIVRNEQEAGWPFMQFSLMAGVETRESAGFGSGRKLASRPFLHSSPLAKPHLDHAGGDATYDFGWNWSVNEINEIFEAPVQTTKDDQGFYGGGYTPDFGTTHVVQQEIPVVPPISLGALSHARLGGFSIAKDPTSKYYDKVPVEAVGNGGLLPQTLQAIGNSYAYPMIPADRAFELRRVKEQPATFADHSYLANKALWDEFFFSSITPQPASVRAYGLRSDRSLPDVAEQFFFTNEVLPNRRMTPYKRNLDRDKLDDLVADYEVFSDGFADKIAAHLMVEGGFNINSTSVDAWKTLFSSLKSKPVAYLDKGKSLNGVTVPDEATPDGTPVSQFTMPNAEPGSGTNDPQDPQQWLGWRELTDDEVEELAEAVVRQVKLRGPFLSLSEFVNRRLDPVNTELSVKGALQAALDDPNVSINAGFRNSNREFSDAEKSSVPAAFPKAMEGPVAYGSAAYVDQADILRNFAAQLSPRGDTFVIRTYGDSLDSNGKVVARAWCEAVVQRMPDYVDADDEPHVKQANLTSDANESFGRKIEVISFRWLNESEV